MKKLVLLIIGLFLVMSVFTYAQDPDDPGEPDSLIIGSAEVPYPPGESCYVDIPVYFVTDDSIPSFFLPISWDNSDGFIYPVEVTWHGIFLDWEVTFDSIYSEQRYIRILGFNDLGDGVVEAPLFTDYERMQGLTIKFFVSSLAGEQICHIDTVSISRTFRLYFSLMHGVDDFVPVVQPGTIMIGDGVDIDDMTEVPLPTEYALNQNYPNPFNPETKIEFQMPEPGYVSLEIYNILGQKIRTLVSEYKDAGFYQIQWNGASDNNQIVPSGIYFCRMSSEEFSKTRKMVMLK